MTLGCTWNKTCLWVLQLFWNGNVFGAIKILTNKICVFTMMTLWVFGVECLFWLIWGQSICQPPFRPCACCKVIQCGGPLSETNPMSLNGDRPVRPVSLDFWVPGFHEACWKERGLHQLCTYWQRPHRGIKISHHTGPRAFITYETGLAWALLSNSFPFLFLLLSECSSHRHNSFRDF